MNSFFGFRKPSSPSSPFQNQIHHPHPPLRIADILNADQDLRQISIFEDKRLAVPSRYIFNSIDSSSPRRTVAKWISGLRRLRVKGDKDEKVLGDRIVEASCLTNDLNQSETGESSRNDNSFNLGVGFCLLYLVAASKNELNKMIDVRMQMEEALVQNTRKNLLKQEELFKHSDGDYFESPSLPDSRVTVCDHSLKWETPQKEEGMDQLEAELEVELERLQLHLDREELLVHPEQIRVTDERTASSKIQTISSGEVIDPLSEDACTDCGVSPDELERRLHELLEARQQEQIRELEAALECLKHKLYEKEMEVSRWKDTATLLSRHASESSPITSENDLKSEIQGEH